MEINHFSHRHPLRVIKAAPYLFDCNACGEKLYSDEMYECESCRYRLDKGCKDLPQNILNPYHLHTLQAEPHQGIQVICSVCCRQVPPGFFYRCQRCNLNLDVKCALYKPTKEELLHFSHFHPLELYETYFGVNARPIECALCNIFDEVPTYACRHCNFYVHQQCSMFKLPQEIQHPSHQCFLTLGTKISEFDFLDLNYCCKNCKFTAKLDLALDFIRLEGLKQFYHFSHRHALELTQKNNEDDQVNCSACQKSCSDPTYGCIACQHFLHPSCIDLPKEIPHFYHPCPLFLRIQPNSFNCGACDRAIQGFYFHCECCRFSMDIECALLPTIKSQSDEEHFCHFSHGHPLILTEINDDDPFYCSACTSYCSGSAVVCRKCSFFLEKSCFDFPREIQHAFHPYHPLILQSKPTEFKPVCDVCCKNLSGLTYCCELCRFAMHMKCSQPTLTISYKGHNHLLLFLENIDTEVKCNSCDTTCDSCVFHCVECDFNLHLLCGPLPCTILPECHYHPFILTDSPLEDESEEFFCDICEKERDPRLSVYNCKDCLFPAEAKCVISEIVLALNGNHGGVELRTLVGQMSGKLIFQSLEVKLKEKQNNYNDAGETVINHVLTWDDMLASFSEDEIIELKGVLAASRWGVDVAEEDRSEDNEVSHEHSEVSLFSCSDLVSAFSGYENMETNGVVAANKREINGGTEVSSKDHRNDGDGKLKISLFSDRAYKNFIEKLHSSTNYSYLTLWEGNEEVVNVMDNLITQKLAPILKKLSVKHGDISAESKLSPRVKNYFTVMLCGTMHSMCNTRIIDISSNLLLNWWNNLKILESAGFKVQFAFDHLEKVVRAFFGLQVHKSEAELNSKIANLSAAIEQLTRDMKELKETRECIALAKASKSDIIMDCLTEASTNKWRTAGTGLL